jgi:hypothetical protein
VSRQREFLADASSAQFTRNPPSLANALKKIGGFVPGSRLTSPRAEEASHLFFANGLGQSFLNLMATHPPLDERIRRLDPSFDGGFIRPGRVAANADEENAAASSLAPPPTDGGKPAPARPAPPRPTPAIPVAPRAVIDRVGTVSPQALAEATSLLADIPSEALDAARTLTGAQAIVYGLLLNREPQFRQNQLAYLSTHLSHDIFNETVRLANLLGSLPRESMLPLMDIAIATLKSLSKEQYAAFRTSMFYLTAADSEITLFEYAAMRMAVRNLDPRFGLASRPVVKHTSLSPLVSDCAVLLSALAWYGHDTQMEAERAFCQGAAQLGAPSGLQLLHPSKASLTDLDTALDALATASPPVKQRLLAAAVAAVSADGTLTPDEAEALRAIADSLDCPVPPFAARRDHPSP